LRYSENNEETMKREKSQTYWVPLSYEYAAEDGTMRREPLRVQYRRVTQAELAALGPQLDAGEVRDPDILERYVTGWDGPQEDDGTPIEWTQAAARDAFLNDMPGLQAVIVRGFFRSQPGAHREKN
jgi:hypothetical protein